MPKKLNCVYEDEVNVIQVEDLLEYLERVYKNKYFYKPIVEIDYPSKTKLLPVFSIYDNLKKIEMSDNEEVPENIILHFENGNKETLLKSEYEKGKIVIAKALIENKDLINIDSLKPITEKPDSYFRTNINRKIEILLPDEGMVNEDKETYKNIKYIVGSVPNKIVSLENLPFNQRIKQNDQIRFKIGDEEDDFSDVDESFYQNRKIRILDKDIYTINGLVFAKTGNNNLLILSKDYEYK